MNNPLTMVVDADVARSSGFSEHPVSSGSRALLDAILKSGHKLALCPTLKAEWKKHRSKYAITWMASMIARKRVVFLKESALTINELIDISTVSDKDKSVAIKDAHLVNAALALDKVIASNDDTARKVFCVISRDDGSLRNIFWFNSVSDREFLQTFLCGENIIPENYRLN